MCSMAGLFTAVCCSCCGLSVSGACHKAVKLYFMSGTNNLKVSFILANGWRVINSSLQIASVFRAACISCPGLRHVKWEAKFSYT